MRLKARTIRINISDNGFLLAKMIILKSNDFSLVLKRYVTMQKCNIESPLKRYNAYTATSYFGLRLVKVLQVIYATSYPE
jgi:hypothetical protein